MYLTPQEDYVTPQEDKHHVFQQHCGYLCHHDHRICGVFIDGHSLHCNLHQCKKEGFYCWLEWSLQELQRVVQSTTVDLS